MKRWLWIGLFCLPVLLLGAHYAYWRMVADRLDHGLARWLAQRQHAGWSTEIGTPVRGGYPLAATLTVPQARLQMDRGALRGGVTWNAERVVLSVMLTQPHLLRIDASGAQRLRLAENPDIPFRADRLRLVLPLDPGFPRWGDVSIAQLRAGIPVGDNAAGLMVEAFRAHGDLRPAAPEGEAAMTFSLHAETLHLPGNLNWALGPDVARIDLNGSIGGPLPRAGTPAQAASQWRDSGGTIDIAALNAQWGPLTVGASATLALDEELQPMGTGSVRIKGQTEALDALVTAGALSQGQARMVRTMIALFAPPQAATGDQPNTGEQEVELPLSLQNRRLFTRQLPLGRLPPLPWPAP